VSIDQPGGLADWQIASAVDQIRHIWRAAGIEVRFGRYGTPSDPLEARVSVRVLTTPPRYLTNGAVVMGWVVQDADGTPRPALFISLPAISGFLAPTRLAGVRFSDLPTSTRDRIVARAAGRVAAHELGHYLLQVKEHHRSGLMRRAFIAQDLVEARLDPFLLGSNESVLLQREVVSLARAQASGR
jgi:hypothetical protein